MTIANTRERTNRQHFSVPRSAPAELLVELIFEVGDVERDLLVLLIGGADIAEAAQRLGINRQAVTMRLQRIRRRAESVSPRGTMKA